MFLAIGWNPHLSLSLSFQSESQSIYTMALNLVHLSRAQKLTVRIRSQVLQSSRNTQIYTPQINVLNSLH